LHIKNTKPQYSILSAIDQNNLHDFVLTNTWENLKINNTKEFLGFLMKVNLNYWCNSGTNLLIQKQAMNFKEILDLTKNSDNELNKIADNDIRNRFTVLQGNVWSFGEKILQDEAIKTIVEVKLEFEGLDFCQIFNKFETVIPIEDLLEVYSHADKEFAQTIIKNYDY
jgi:hypothetical protein